jgi:hypothetical protein
MGFESDSKAGTRNVQEYAADTVATLVTDPDPNSIDVGFTADGHFATWINGAWVIGGASGGGGSGAGATGATGAQGLGANGGLLAYVEYAPSTPTTYTTTSATLAAVDTTNLTISFTAPASGNVLVRVTACCNENDSGDIQGYLALLDHTSHAQVGYSANVAASNVAGMIANVSPVWLITGLVEGDSYQYDVAFGVASGAVTGLHIFAQGNTGCENYGGPVMMEVWSA